MKYTESLGILSDVLQYFVVYFNENDITYKRKHFSDSQKNELQFYYDVKGNDIEISDIFQPFFYYDKKTEILVTNFLYKICLTKKADTVEKFIEYIKNSSEFKNIFISHFFSNIQDSKKFINTSSLDKSDIYSNILNSNYPRELIFKILYVIDNFEHVINQLIITIDKIHKAILKLRVDNEDIIKDFVKNFESGENIKALSEKMPEDMENLHKYLYSAELISSWHFISIDNSFILAGVYYSLEEKNDIIYDHVDFCSISKSFDDARNKIMALFLSQSEITALMIRKLLQISQQAVHKHISILREEGAIYISKRYKNELYYSANFEYFNAFEKYFKVYTEKITKVKNGEANK